MKAIILNSGIGKRMGELTRDNPKCLVKISGNDTILSHEIKLLQANGIDEFIITTGPFHTNLEKYIMDNFPSLHVSFVHNPNYAETNYIYSMYLASDKIRDDLILLHGDMVMEPAVCNLLIRAQAGNAVVVNAHVPLPEKDFKGKLYKGRIEKIGVYLTGDDCVFLLPIYKLSKDAMCHWMDEIADFMVREVKTVYAEEAFNNISDRLLLTPVYIDRGAVCMEIDTPEDLAIARGLLRNPNL